MKQFQVTPRDVPLSPDEKNDIYVDINDDLLIRLTYIMNLYIKLSFE